MTMWADGGPYELWSVTLRRWAAGESVDTASLPALSSEDFAADQWVRVTERMTEAIDRRLAAWSTALTRAVGEASDEFGVARGLTQARTGLRSIRELAGHPGLPPDLSRRFVAAVDTQVRTAQRLLEQQVETMRRSGVDHSRVEARRRTLRDNPLTAVISTAAAPTLMPTEPGSSRRRVLPPPPRGA